MPKGIQGFVKGHPPYTSKGNFPKGHIPWNKGLHKFLGGGFRRGKKHAKWNGGKFVSQRGYVYIFKPNHPFAIYGGRYIAKHKLVIEKYLKRYIKSNEVIHHINGDKSDNRIKNLIVFNGHKAHRLWHINPKKIKERYIIFDGRFVGPES